MKLQPSSSSMGLLASIGGSSFGGEGSFLFLPTIFFFFGAMVAV